MQASLQDTRATDPTLLRAMLDRLPVATYACAADGRLTYFNAEAAQVWGREPTLGDASERYCGAHRLFAADGSPLDRDECWMARALQEGRDYLGREMVLERPDAALVRVLAHARLVRDEQGEVVGGFNTLVDVSDRDQREWALRAACQTKDQYMATAADGLRAQLASIVAQLEALRSEPGLSDLGAGSVGAVRHQLDEMERLVSDLLDAPGAGGRVTVIEGVYPARACA